MYGDHVAPETCDVDLGAGMTGRPPPASLADLRMQGGTQTFELGGGGDREGVTSCREEDKVVGLWKQEAETRAR